MLAGCADENYPDHVSLLQIASDTIGGIALKDQTINVLMKESDLKFGNWKRAKAILR